MPIDTSMYNQNPAMSALAGFENAFKMTQQVKQAKEQNAVKQAYRDSVDTDQNGVSSINSNKLMSSLAKASPEAFAAYQTQELQKAKFTQENQLAQLKLHNEQLNMIGQVGQGMTDQTSYQNGLAQLKQFGIPVNDAPPQYDPAWVKQHTSMAMSAKDKLGLTIKQQEADAATTSAGARVTAAGAAVNRSTGTSAKDQNTAMGQTINGLEQMRGNPAVQQAEKDLYAAGKVESLVNLYGDPDKLDSRQAQLVASEVGKIATGGVPTIHELEGLNKNTIPKALASAAETFMNRPLPANQGAFVGALQDYVKSLKKDAQGVIQDKYGRYIDSNHDRIGEKNYQTLQDKYVNRFNKPAGVEQKQASSFSQDVQDFAKSHNITNEQAQSVKDQRTGQKAAQ